jgi:alkanesulfonate monooxygenase SsuD/methylene tetrahydromethanopterin reductase-like flavin-dependent oxidoreductase (luciferase family)
VTAGGSRGKQPTRPAVEAAGWGNAIRTSSSPRAGVWIWSASSPAQQWGVMAGLARRADANPSGSRSGSMTTSTPPASHAGGDPRGVVADGGLAGITGRVRLGQMCTCMSYRNPGLSGQGGRDRRHRLRGPGRDGHRRRLVRARMAGLRLRLPAAGERLGRLREGVEIFRQAWTTGSATLDGEHYQVDGALNCHPRPLQGTSLPGRPATAFPMWIAGGGEKEDPADRRTSMPTTPTSTARCRGLRAQVRAAREHCDAVGRDVAEITRSSANFNVVIGESEKEVERSAGLASASTCGVAV